MSRNSAARYLAFGRFRLRVPRRRGVRMMLGLALLVRGLLPPTGPMLLPAALTLLSMDMPKLRRLRRRLLIRLGRRRTARKGGPREMGTAPRIGLMNRERLPTSD